MKITVTHPYLVFPVNNAKSMKKLLFKIGGECVYEMDIRLDTHNPDFYAYLDVARFMGQRMELSTVPEMAMSFREADAIDRVDLYREAFRPLCHFTEKNGWLNDPNGLVRLGDTWHMYYQQNPAAPEWGNMHWGHATSPDLTHWTQHPSALFPDEMGAMFSGSAIIDKDGVAGLGRGTALFFYTAAGGSGRAEGQPFTQCLAYSTDGGMTLHKYEKNPVIPHIIGGNRDPKVIWCEELNTYVCALYLEGNTYALLTSDNLLDWTLIQKIVLDGDAECPDFYPLTADDGTRKWVFSGASGRYRVGDIVNGQFIATQPIRGMHTGSLGYAAQTYSTPDDGRRINVTWERVDFPGNVPFRSQMGIPVTHVLRRDADGYYLHASPVKEAKKLRGTSYAPEATADGFTCTVSDAANEVLLTVPAGGGVVSVSLLGITVTIDREQLRASLGEQWIPLGVVDGKIKVRMFSDTCSLEIFTETHYACFSAVCDENLSRLTVSGECDADLSVWPLAHIH